MRRVFLILFIFQILIGCHENEKKSNREGTVIEHNPDPSAVKLNNKAVRFMGQASLYHDATSEGLYDSALFYLDRAVEIDSLYLMAYTNKSRVLLRKNLPEKSLSVLSKAQAIKPDFAEAIMSQGFIFEKMGDEKLADEKFKQSLDAYRKRLKKNPQNLKAKADIAFLYIFLEDTNKASNEIQNLILENPGNNDLIAMERIIKDFDKRKFIAEY